MKGSDEWKGGTRKRYTWSPVAAFFMGCPEQSSSPPCLYHPGLKKKALRDICKKGGKGNCRYAALRKWFRDEHNEHSSSE